MDGEAECREDTGYQEWDCIFMLLGDRFCDQRCEYTVVEMVRD